MTAELEAVVVAAYRSADENRPLARRGPCDPPSANRCSMVANPKPGETARGRTHAAEAGIGFPTCPSWRRGPAARLP